MKHSQTLVLGLRLCLICAVAALCLGLLNEVTEPAIVARKVQEEKDALAWLIPEGRPGEKVAVEGDAAVTAYYPVSVAGSSERYILDLRGAGYGGDMKILAAYMPDGTLLGAKLLDNQETPGLGKRAESPTYMDMFAGRGSADAPVPVSKEMLGSGGGEGAAGSSAAAESRGRFRFFPRGAAEGGTDAVSGATVTFLGVSRALAAGAAYVRREWGGS